MGQISNAVDVMDNKAFNEDSTGVSRPSEEDHVVVARNKDAEPPDGIKAMSGQEHAVLGVGLTVTRETLSRVSERQDGDEEDGVDTGEVAAKSDAADLSQVIRSLDWTLRRHISVLSKAERERDLTPETVVQPTDQQPAGPKMTRRESQRLVGFIDQEPNRAGVSRTDKVTVSVQVQFLKVGEIDTIHDRYAADVLIQTKWHEPLMDNKQFKSSNVTWEAYWNPNIYVENSYSDAVTKETTTYSVSYDSLDRATVTEKRHVSGSFFEYMELNQFPFDNQDLTVTISTNREETELEFVEDVKERSMINANCFVDEQEWSLHKVINTWKKTTIRVSQDVIHKHPGFSAACKASRRPGFFIWNILVVMFLICSLSFATFTVNASLPHFRLQLSFILLLTTVTFKFVVNQSLPRIPYLTYMDKYVLASMCNLCAICVWHAIVNTVTASMDDYWSMVADKVALGVLAAVYVGYHLFFVILIIYLARRRSRIGESCTGITEVVPADPVEMTHAAAIPSYDERRSVKRAFSVFDIPPSIPTDVSDHWDGGGGLVNGDVQGMEGGVMKGSRRMSVQVESGFIPQTTYRMYRSRTTSFARNNSVNHFDY